MRLLTVLEAAARLGLRPATIRSWIWTRKIDYVKLGRSVRLREDTIEEIITNSTIPARDWNVQPESLRSRRRHLPAQEANSKGD